MWFLASFPMQTKQRLNEVNVSGNPAQSLICVTPFFHTVTLVLLPLCPLNAILSSLNQFFHAVVSLISASQLCQSFQLFSLVTQFSHSVVVSFISSELRKAAATEVRRPSIKC